MAILGFHFSGVYKEGLLSKEKSATIMGGQQNFNLLIPQVFVWC